MRPKAGDWTIDEFVDAVQDPGSRAFLLRLLELAAVNDQRPSEQFDFRLYFGTRPGGAMFVYPFGRRCAPFKFSINSGQLMIAGGWNVLGKYKGHPGFAPLAAMLGQDERGTAKAVSVVGLDADELWKVGKAVSQAVNG